MSEQVEESKQEGDILEGYKHYFEFFKHLTTINTGSIIILITFIEKLFANPEWNFLIIVCLVGFLISLMCSLGAMWFVSTLIAGKNDKFEIMSTAFLWLVSIIGFLLGIIALAIFSIKNFY